MSKASACLARLLERDPLRFLGVMVERDGSPSELGRILRGMVRVNVGGASGWLESMIDEHPSGWDSVRTGQCLCGAGRSPSAVTEENAAEMGVRFVYAFCDEGEGAGRKMLVLAPTSRRPGGWWVVLETSLGGPEPDWAAVETAAAAGA